MKSTIRGAACLWFIACLSGCAKDSPTSPGRHERAPAEGASSTESTTPAQPAGAPAPADLTSSLAAFATTTMGKIGHTATIAVLPICTYDNQQTACSTYLSEQLQAALAAAAATVLDRSSLEAILKEVDLASAFERPSSLATVRSANALILGRYTIAAGRVQIDLKVSEVPSAQVIHAETVRSPLTPELRQLAYAPQSFSGNVPLYTIEEDGHIIRVTARYGDAGADQLRLLDRARQIIRRGLADYLRNGLGKNVSDSEVEDRFRRGTETECQFDRDSVVLQMRFGGLP